MTEFLLFRLYGPMASWGEIAVGENRGSNLVPTRSALLGLLGAACGVRRDDAATLAELGRSVAFAVQVASAGVPLSDYHTAQVSPPKKGRALTRAAQLRVRRDELETILSRREYRCDALAHVAAWAPTSPAPERFSLAALAAALARPVFPLSLGRKSCPPALPLAPRVVVAETLGEAFRSDRLPDFQESPLAKLNHLGTPMGLYWEGDPPGAPNPQREIVRRDDPVSRTQWLFRNRRERFAPSDASAPSSPPSGEHTEDSDDVSLEDSPSA